jgi:hypothetical protein
VTRITVVPCRAQDVTHFERQPLAKVDVEIGERLVEQQQSGRRRERAGERDALLLPARQFVRPRPCRVGEADQRKHRVDARRNVRHRASGQARMQRCRARRGAETVRSPETPCRRRGARSVRWRRGSHDAPAERHGAGAQRLESGEAAQDRRLAAA